MTRTSYRFTFDRQVSLADVDATMKLSLIAAEGIHGEARLRVAIGYAIEPIHRALRLEGEAPAIDTVVQIFTAFATREFGSDAFSIVRVSVAPSAVAG